MPVAVNFGNDVTLHKEAESWMYEKFSNTEVIVLLDEDGMEINTEIIAENACQITTLTDEEYQTARESMR